ncbi:MAG TPA: thioredoxin family protein [Deltaproteobacteria bacterium]|nr:thioredoxin family protein [Deltaproteobacteria bacterium]HQB38780.1 thioredoxin family protein [Deltaproteobacteria bacterium]
MRTMLIAVLLTLSCMGYQSVAAAELPPSNEAVIKKAIASGRPSVVDFGARSCIPCKRMAPILEELSRELKGKANVVFVDVWKDGSFAHKYRIQMIPTQLFFDANGREVKRHMGFMDKAALVKELKSAGMQ